MKARSAMTAGPFALTLAKYARLQDSELLNPVYFCWERRPSSSFSLFVLPSLAKSLVLADYPGPAWPAGFRRLC